ncbi:hypothetical protein RHSIM_Rhsim04G0070500 [Rhododendron simsii]|uniref:Uncharacterized protein n=1 Tax=Rhododendron simsii TaxID=118357 RepID=A0A834HDM2_RHOSS|nr:hypothetical protein RHSIM_Rhsim04G0070500 [Rhododendron simsii]
MSSWWLAVKEFQLNSNASSMDKSVIGNTHVGGNFPTLIRLRAICKKWGKLTRWRIEEDQSPMISRGYWTTTGMMKGTGFDYPMVLVCKLFDSSHRKPYSVDQVIGQAFEGQPDCIDAVVFSGGLLYCLFRNNGALAAFSVANRDWSLVTQILAGYPREGLTCSNVTDRFLFAYLDGHTLSGLDNGQCRLFSFSQSRRAWVAETSFLANQALFLDRTSSFSASGETTNKVY